MRPQDRGADLDVKGRLTLRQLTLGSWVTLAHPAVAEIMAQAGFDWLVIDLEHSVISLREAEDLIRVIESEGVAPLVRLTSNSPDQAKRVMDAGARGVVVPMVTTAEDAERAVRAVKYPPTGTRGVGLARAQGYGTRFAEYASSINARSIVVAQIEHVDAVNRLEEILAVPGIDATIIGPYDLSASMGKPGRYEDRDVAEVLARYEEISDRCGKPKGYHLVEPDPAAVTAKIHAGYCFMGFSVDFLFLGGGCRNGLRAVRAQVDGVRA